MTALATGSINTVTVTDVLGVVPPGPPPGAETVIVTTPGEIAVSSPEDETVATASLLDRHSSDRPVRGWPAPSRGVAVKIIVLPAGRLPPSGSTVMLATGLGAP
jgi:hypothetical protein